MFSIFNQKLPSLATVSEIDLGTIWFDILLYSELDAMAIILTGISKFGIFFFFIKSILKSLEILAMWLALSSAIYSRIAPSFALNRIFFLAKENGTVKLNNQSDFKAFLN